MSAGWPWQPGQAAPDHYSEALKHQHRRTPEALADIAAARAAPTGMEVAMQEVDRQLEQALDEARHPAFLRGPVPANVTAADLEATPGQPKDLDAALSNAALADTPAVREMGGPAQNGAFPLDGCAHSMFTPGCRACAVNPRCCARPMNPMPNGTLWCDTCGASRVVSLPRDAIVLTGPEAERYRAMQAAARKAQASAATARTDGAALLQLFQAFCAGLAPGKEG